MPMFPGRAAAIRFPGAMRARRSGFASKDAMWRCVAALNSLPETRPRYDAIRSVARSEHHEGIPLGNKQTGKTLIHIQQSAPVMERRSLNAYESLAAGGGR